MTNASSGARPAEDVVAIVGVGLIGGSIAAAVKQRNLARRVIGLGRNEQRLAEAQRRALIDEFTLVPAEAARANLVIVCTPVDGIVDEVRSLAPHAAAGTLISDAGSVKRTICGELARGLPDQVTFIGAHPLAGSDRQGFEHADPDLFEQRACIVTPNDSTPAQQLSRLVNFWRGLGAVVTTMTAERHDHLLAQTSHLPHVVAAALAALLTDENRAYASSGFRDTSRVAAGDPGLWVHILLDNADEIVPHLDAFSQAMDDFRLALKTGDGAALKNLLHDAKTKRDALNRPETE